LEDKIFFFSILGLLVWNRMNVVFKTEKDHRRTLRQQQFAIANKQCMKSSSPNRYFMFRDTRDTNYLKSKLRRRSNPEAAHLWKLNVERRRVLYKVQMNFI
jgi:hypothetical protein